MSTAGKKTFVIFGFETLFVPDREDFNPLIWPALQHGDLLRAFIASEKDPGFSWDRIAMLRMGSRFCIIKISDPDSQTGRIAVLEELVNELRRKDEIGKIFLFSQVSEEVEFANKLGLTSVHVVEDIVLSKELSFA